MMNFDGNRELIRNTFGWFTFFQLQSFPWRNKRGNVRDFFFSCNFELIINLRFHFIFYHREQQRALLEFALAEYESYWNQINSQH